MPQEIERKFLVNGDAWRSLGQAKHYCQGYIVADANRTVRVRVVGRQGWLTIKGASSGITRAEFEYPIPVEDALELLQTLCQPPLIEKNRYRIEHAGLVWEVDEFVGENAGLIVAEVELDSAEQSVNLPNWIGAEVSSDRRYFNSNLTTHPYSQW